MRAALLLIGFTSVVAQIVLMRELMVVFYGNELSLGIMLACWLLWTAAGAELLGRFGTTLQPKTLVATLECAMALGFPLAIFAVRESRMLFEAARGEVLGLGPMFLTAFGALALVCPLTGWLFAAGSRMVTGATDAATTSVYILEAAGSAIGGLAASFALMHMLQPFAIAGLVGVLNLLAATALLGRRACPLVPFLPILLGIGWWADAITLDRLWRGFHLLAATNSLYNNLAVLENEGSRSLAENGMIAATVPDPAAAEEAVHLPLLMHPNPRRVLLIGGGVNGSLREALKHPLERLDYVELDPAIPQLARRYFPGAIPSDPRLDIHAVDGRLFINTATDRFDAVLINLPEPRTAQLNRFYTAEFFTEALHRLRPGGLVELALPASETYISPDAAELLQCIRHTLQSVFPHVAMLPGETVHLIGSTVPLATDADTLLSRLRERKIETRYINQDFLPFRLSPLRTAWIAEQTNPLPATPANRDFAPVAYYFDLSRWSAQFGGIYGRLLEYAGRTPFWCAAAGLLLVSCVALLLRPTPPALCMGATGFTMIGVEILLLLGFQSLYGYVYQQLALLVAAFMAGMALGSAAGRRFASPLAAVQVAVAATPVAVCGILKLGPAVVAAAALVCGALGGYQFAVASGDYFKRKDRAPGRLYAADLAGSCAGALLTGIYAIPVFGFFRSALLLALANAICGVRLSACRRLSSRRGPARAPGQP